MKDRAAGVLLAISSLPSKYGIGTLGKEAYHFVDQLAKANQRYWQVLPVGPTTVTETVRTSLFRHLREIRILLILRC